MPAAAARAIASPTMRASRSVPLAALTCACALAAAACASEAEPSASGGDPGGGSVSDYLGQLPARDDDLVMVTYGDIARAVDIAGLERPDDISDSDAIVDFVMDVSGQRQEEDEPARVAVLLPEAAQPNHSVSDLEGFVDDVGWSLLEVDSFAGLDTPPDKIAVLDGRFDGDLLDETLEDAGDGVWVAGDPDGDMDFDDTTPARPLGESVWLALDGGRLTATWNEDDMATTRDADGGDGTLADDEALSSLAAALDDQDVYSAMLATGGQIGGLDPGILGESATPEQLEELEEELEGSLCEGVTGIAAGVADDGEPLIVLALSHVDEASAEGNVDIVAEALESGEQPRTGITWSDYVTLEAVEADGRVLVATMRPADMVLGQWYSFLYDRSFPPC
jgi:hypothetical protein